MTRSYEKTQIMHRLKDLLPPELAKQGDRVLKAAAELLERRKAFHRSRELHYGTRIVDNVSFVVNHRTFARPAPDQQLTTLPWVLSASDYRHGIEKKRAIRRSHQSRLYLDKAKETL